MPTNLLHSSAELEIFSVDTVNEASVPLASEGVSAGFPSPAGDFVESSIDFNKHLIAHPAATFCAWVKGDSMVDMGIENGSLLVIDKSLEPQDGKIAVCFIDGEFTLKRIQTDKDCCWLVPANDNYKPIRVTEDNAFVIWGIATFCIKKL
jgi:DNA polymerase V